jgi:natural product biosynthesis luciferase-like monooxygenase protein
VDDLEGMESIAIVGVGCRFPGASTPESFWELLTNGVDAIREVPAERWNVEAFYASERGMSGKTVSRWGGFLDRVDYFDPEFFEMAESDVGRIDPHQKLVLEVAWESLENAGIVPATLAGSQTGVFIGMSQSDHNRLLYQDVSNIKPNDGPNTYLCLAANRLSYFLNIQGPSLVIDTACSSSLVALHYACQSLRSRDCHLALAGGVNILLSPEEFIAFSHQGTLSAEGRCKTLDASADGYVRGEGCGIFVLKRLSEALEAGDRILAVIKGSAVNQNGLSHGVTAPNGLAQQHLIRQALENAEVTSEEISYVEIHGTGTFIGDAIEYQALKAELMKDRKTDSPCWIGCVKTNIGHLEAASGSASLLKVILSLQHQKIPPNLHFKQLNPYISLSETTFSIPTELQSWTPGAKRRLAGISTFGFGGSNAHLIVEESPIPSEIVSNPIERPLHILTLSAKTEKALQELASNYLKTLQNPVPETSLADVCFTANCGRTHFKHRLAAVAESFHTLREQLSAFRSGTEQEGLIDRKITSTKQPTQIVFLFPEQVDRAVVTGWQLYETQPTFRAAIDHCNQTLRPYLEKSLIEVLYTKETEGKKELENNSLYSQTALFAVQYALAELWKSWGIKPTAVMGYGVGEYVAACLAGIFSLEDALKLVIGKTAAEVTYASPSLPIIARITGKEEAAKMVSSEYWNRSFRPPVQLDDLEEAIKSIPGLGDNVLIEIGPRSPLLDKIRSCLPAGTGVCLPGIGQEESDWKTLLHSLGTLYNHLIPIDWSGFDRDYHRRRQSLPTYPFQRQRSWFRDEAEPFYPISGALDEIEAESRPSTQPLNVCSQPESEPTKENCTTKGSEHLPTSTRASEIQNWITDWLSRKLKIEPKLLEKNPRRKSFLDYGLKSVEAVELAIELERWLGCSLDATLVWNFPTIESLAGHLAGEGKISDRLRSLPCQKETPLKLPLPALQESAKLASVSGSPAKTEPRILADEPRSSSTTLQFSLLYFSSNEAEFTTDKYQLLIEGAKFADKHKFAAVWIPERHFHPFGGLYPNPSVLGSALAMLTERIRIRAGSVVLPLQNPIRVAEEWAVVDNLSKGRVDVAFARGWNPNDFVLAPNHFAKSREIMFEGIETVKKLWQGESISLTNGTGQETAIRIYPLPQQREIPIWITCTGGKERFIETGAMGANVITALLFQPIEELAEKIALYRESRAQHGHDPQTGHVTLMVHTFIGEDMEFVRRQVRQPFTSYLESSVSLWRHGFKNLNGLSEREKEHLLAYAFERYFQTSALMGTPDTCLEMVKQLKAVGVNEIACLIDFGIDADSVLASLYSLKKLKERSESITETSTTEIFRDSSLGQEKVAIDSPLSTRSNHWILDIQDRPEAKFRLFCLPYAGGNISVFRHWSEDLPPEIEVCALEISEKAVNQDQPWFDDLDSLIEDLARFLLPHLDRPFAFYGHSLGALINFELSRYLRREYKVQPVHFWVGSQHAPHLPCPYPSFNGLTRTEMIALAKELGNIELLNSLDENDPLWRSLLTSLKTASKLQNETYDYNSEEEPLACPITVFGGTQDKFLTQDHLSAWQVHTNSSFKLKMLAGSHLFTNSQIKPLLSEITQELMSRVAVNLSS